MHESIRLPPRLYLSSVEQLLLSIKPWVPADLTIDFRDTTFSGLYALGTIARWVHAARAADRSVHVVFPDGSHSRNNPLLQLLGATHFSEFVRSSGATVSERFAENPNGVPFTGVSSATNLTETVRAATASSRGWLVEELDKDPELAQRLETILVELLENAILHTGGRNAFFLLHGSVAAIPEKSSDPRRGLMVTFAPGTRYLEAIVGDLGPGLEKTLKAYIPEGYQPPFSSGHRYLRDEVPIAYAFEYSSTSNPDARAERIRRVLAHSSGPAPASVATGLFRTLAAVQQRGGQLLLRTPASLLSFDFTLDATEPRVRGRADAGLPTLRRMPGTQYTLRIPVSSSNRRRPSSARLETLRSPVVSLDPFPFEPHLAVSATVHSAVRLLDAHFQRVRELHGTTLIMWPPSAFSPRAHAVVEATIDEVFAGRQEKVLAWAVPEGGTRGIDPLSPRVVDPHAESSYRELQRAYQRLCRARCVSHLQSPEVRLTEGPFLIERQYYTRVYFRLMAATENNDFVRSLIDWLAVVLSHTFATGEPAVLIVVGAALQRVLAPLAERFANVGVDLAVLDATGSSPGALTSSLLSRALMLAGRKAVVLTDVICRGRTVQTAIRALPHFHVRLLVALVDGRSVDAEETVQLGLGSVPVRTILREPIEALVDRPAETGDGRTTQKVVLFDSGAASPSAFARNMDSRLPLLELTRRLTETHDSLRAGHVRNGQKHYSFFIDFTRFFPLLKDDIASWVIEDIQFVAANIGASPPTLMIHDPDGSLSWLGARVADSLPNVELVHLGQELLHPPRSKPSTRVADGIVLLVPGLASGDSARSLLEYAAQLSPKHLSLCAVSSRMDARSYRFLSDIDRYKGAKLSVRTFFQLPIAAFGAGPGACPMCSEQAGVEALRAHTRADALLSAIDSWLGAHAAMPVESSTDGQHSTPHDTVRLSLRALYERSASDVESRKELKEQLLRSGGFDRFLEIVANERMHPSFTIEHLSTRLYDTSADLLAHAHHVCDHSEPPYPIGRVALALAHLVPSSLSNAMPGLLRRFQASQVDVDHLVVAALRSGISSEALARTDRLDAPPLGASAQAVVDGARTLLDAARDNVQQKQSEAADAAARLWAMFTRSTALHESIARMSSVSDDQTAEVASSVYRHWIADGPRLVRAMARSPMWANATRRAPELTDGLSKIERNIVIMGQLSQRPGGESAPRLRETARVVLDLSQQVSKCIYSLFCNPVLSVNAALHAFAKDPAASRRCLRLPVCEEYGAGNLRHVFAVADDLELVCWYIVENWIKHSATVEDGTLRVGARIHYDNGLYVVLEFVDNIPGALVFGGRGGLNSAREQLSLLGASMDQATSGDEKTVRLRFPACSSDHVVT